MILLIAPFAVAIIGGLITDTVLTLFILPLPYPVFEPNPAAAPESLPAAPSESPA